MAQYANNLTEQEQQSLYHSLRDIFTSQGINTLEDFNGLDKTKTEICLIRLYFLTVNPVSGKRHPIVTDRMLSLIESSSFERFKPIVTVILGNEAKPNQEMYDLIAKEFIDLPSPSAPSALTPVKITTASLVDSSQRVDDLLPTLKHELNKLMYKDVPDLVEHLFQHHHVDFAEILQPHKRFIKQKYEEQMDDTSEPSMLAWITPLVENCFTWLKEAGLNEQLSRAWVCPEQYLIGVEGRRKLDCAIVSQSFWRSNHIEHVLVPVELKKKDSDDRDANICLAKYVYEVFLAQPTRSYVIGFTMCGTSMRLWQFDRSGAIGSELFDIKKNEDNFYKFLTIILFLLTSNKQVLGFDPSFIDIAAKASTHTQQSQMIQIGTEPNHQELTIDHLIFRAHSICGRGTTCWQAHLSGDECTKFVVKDSWQPAHRKEEGVMLREVTEKKRSSYGQILSS